MVKVKPFKAFLANREIAHRLISPPYDVISSSEARALVKGNQFSFLHVKKPEIDLPEDTDHYSDIVYQTGRINLQKFV
jgi:uncharacterized protein (DUF1015 family)